MITLDPDRVRWNMKAFFTLGCWSRNYPYSESWDRALNQLLDDFEFSEIGEHLAKLGPVTVWIANHPYASFSPYCPKSPVLPKRSTVMRAHERLYDDIEWNLERISEAVP